jgi:hypothetical protein
LLLMQTLLLQWQPMQLLLLREVDLLSAQGLVPARARDLSMERSK